MALGMVGLGLSIQVGLAVTLALFDEMSASKKTCFHLSEKEIEIFLQHQVKYLVMS